MIYPSDYKTEKFHNNTLILINSCDAYSDVLSIMIKSLEVNWSNNPFKIVINTESNKSIWVKNNVKWGARLLETLSELNCDYIITLMDDFILEEVVNMDLVYKALSVMDEDPSIAVFYLAHSESKTVTDGDYYQMDLAKESVLNCHPAIWRKKELINMTKSYDNPWSWETFGSYRAVKSIKKFCMVSSKSLDVYKYKSETGGAIYRGLWVKNVVEPWIHNYNIKIDLDKRGILEPNKTIKRSIKWKLNFLYLGFRSMGFGMIIYIYNHYTFLPSRKSKGS